MHIDPTRIIASNNLTTTEIRDFLSSLLAGQIPPEEGGALLAAWSQRGETSEELAAVVSFLTERMVRIPWDAPCLEVCGTGGCLRPRFNVSTTVAVLLSALGIPVAKHGNRGSRLPNGSFDLLDHLGINYNHPPETQAKLLKTHHLCFLFARTHHPAVGAAAPARKAAGRRTIFNLAGPLSNPASPSHQVTGCIDRRTAQVVAGALEHLGRKRALVIWGYPDLDEVSIEGPTGYFLVEHGKPTVEGILHAHYPTPPAESVMVGDAAMNAAIFRRILSGEERGPLRDLVLVNAAVALCLWEGRAIDHACQSRLRPLLESGAALKTFEDFQVAI